MQLVFDQSPLIFVAVAFIVALLIGSFLNVVIYRLPIMMRREWQAQCAELAAEPPAKLPEGRFDLMFPRSACPNCGQAITALQNIPVLSYVILRGRCAGCNTPISARYPVIEFLTALLSAIVAWRFGFGWEGLAAIALTWVLIALSVIDIDHQLIPDSISLPLLLAGLTLSLFHPVEGAVHLFVAPKEAIIGALVGYLSLWSVYQAFRIVTGKEGMGYGDFKLLGALGAWLGWQMLPIIILLSAVVGASIGSIMILTKRHERSVPIPFGPYLVAAGWIAMLWGPQIITWYLDLTLQSGQNPGI